MKNTKGGLFLYSVSSKHCHLAVTCKSHIQRTVFIFFILQLQTLIYFSVILCEHTVVYSPDLRENEKYIIFCCYVSQINDETKRCIVDTRHHPKTTAKRHTLASLL